MLDHGHWLEFDNGYHGKIKNNKILRLRITLPFLQNSQQTGKIECHSQLFSIKTHVPLLKTQPKRRGNIMIGPGKVDCIIGFPARI